MPDINEPTEAAPALLPCPFCGGTNLIVLPRTCDRNTPYDPNDRAMPAVRCLTCYGEAVGKDWSGSETAIVAWNRRVSSAPSFADGIEAAAKWHETQPFQRADGHAQFAKAIRALAHNPQASNVQPATEPGERDREVGELPYAFITCTSASPDYYVTVKTRDLAGAQAWHEAIIELALHKCDPAEGNPLQFPPRSGAAEGNEAEAAAPKPDPAIAELVKPDWYSDGYQIKSIPFNDNGLEAAGLYTEATMQRIVEAALTAPNDRVAELERERDDLQHAWLGQRKRAEATERERDEANEARATWAYNAGHSADELLRTQRALKAAEAEVSRLKAELKDARDEVWHLGMTVGQIAKWPRSFFNRIYIEEWAIRTATILKRWHHPDWSAPLTVVGEHTKPNKRLEETLAALSNQAGASK